MDDLDLITNGHGKGRGDRFRVISDAVVGGGVDFRRGQVLCLAELGDLASVLIECGAVVPVSDIAAPVILL